MIYCFSWNAAGQNKGIKHSNSTTDGDHTRLRNWFCSSLEDRPSEAWQDSDSNDLMRWAEECRAHTESLPTPISEQRGDGINTQDLVCTQRPPTHSWLPVCLPTSLLLTHAMHVLTHLLSLYSEKPGCSEPLRSSVPAAGRWPQTAVGERESEREVRAGRREAESHQPAHFPFTDNHWLSEDSSKQPVDNACY